MYLEQSEFNKQRLQLLGEITQWMITNHESKTSRPLIKIVWGIINALSGHIDHQPLFGYLQHDRLKPYFKYACYNNKTAFDLILTKAKTFCLQNNQEMNELFATRQRIAPTNKNARDFIPTFYFSYNSFSDMSELG